MIPRSPDAPTRLSLVALASFALSGCGGSGDAQAAAARGSGAGADGTLGEPNAVFPEDFGAIQTVRELADGTVLVADPIGNALFQVDMDTGTRTQVGTQGQGPEEYQQPDAAWPLPGDSTMVIDLGNGRILTLDPDLRFVDTSPLSAGDPRSGMVVAIPQGVDGEGRIYARSMGGMRAPSDSGAVLRVERGSMAVDTVTRFGLAAMTRTESGGSDNRSVNIQPIPLSPEDAWGVSRDGSVVVARAADYHVEWYGADGSRTAGPAIPFEPVSIGTAEKQRWVDGQGRTGGGLSVMVMAGPQGMQMSFGRGGSRGGAPDIDDFQWPETMAPFSNVRILVDPTGRAWVTRNVPAGEDAAYDVFDRSGRRVASYTVDGDRRVIAFGQSSVYVVSYDEFDLNYLERYALPR